MTSMSNEYGRFRGVEFRFESLPLVRNLALGESITLTGRYERFRTNLDELAGMGFADKNEEVSGYGTDVRTTYRASPELLALADIPPISFDEMAKKMGRSLDREAQRKWRVKFKPGRLYRVFPTEREVLSESSEAELRSVQFEDCFTEHYPVEPDDNYLFSSPGLSAWYVTRFCADNHLK